MAAKKKTWSKSIEDIDETARKWGDTIDRIEIENSLAPRSRQKQYHDLQERTVSLRFLWRPPNSGGYCPIRVGVRTAERAEENLRLIAVAFEMMRLAEVRGVHKILGAVYRQMYPSDTPKPPPAEPRQIPPHYAMLYLEPSAPLVVAEAAYRALARTAHPDTGGNGELMMRLNAAIEQIRKEKQERPPTNPTA